MVAPFLHYEVLGPRADLDAWLASIQDVGVCHLADALSDLEGHAGIGRPELRAEEVHAGLLRSEASRALHGVERILPATPRTAALPGAGSESEGRRPQWTLGPGGVGERELHTLKDEARGIADALASSLEAVLAAEEEVERLDALAAACAVLASAEAPTFDAEVLALPRRDRRDETAPGRHQRGPGRKKTARRLQRRVHGLLTGGAPRPLRGMGQRTHVVVLRPPPAPSSVGASGGASPGDTSADAGPAPEREIARAAAALGARAVRVPAAVRGAPLQEARVHLVGALEEARQVEARARVALNAEVAERGERGRFLLDSLEDSDGRTRARSRLASSEHVTAARLYVRPEDEPLLRERLHAAHGESVVLRPLAEAADAPGLPRRVATAPFAVLDSLLPGRFGEVSAAALLALFTPLAVGLIWADVAGGVFLLLAGGLLGSGAGPGSPRRDTALLAQVGGLLSLVLGVLAGRAFGPAGISWFGADWGQAPQAWITRGVEPVWAAPFIGVLWALGAVSTLAGLWGLLLSGLERARGHAARARATLLGALHYAVVAGVAAAFLPADNPLAGAWIVAPAAAVGVFLIGGPRRFLFQLCLDLVGVLRLVAVAGAALTIFEVVLASWLAPDAVAALVGGLALIVAALAVVADPAHLAMGVPYDLALGGQRLRRPFEPFRRRTRRGGDDVAGTWEGGPA